MTSPLKESAQRVQDALRDHGLFAQVVVLSASTRSAQEAAEALGCDVARIVKSLVFKAKRTDRPVLVLASGANRVDVKKLRRVLGEKVGRADATFVRETTGFAIGGIPPVGHIQPLETIIDLDLLQHQELWAAAGTPHAVFRCAPQFLEGLGQVVDLKKDEGED